MNDAREPLGAHARLAWLDALRALALLGIFLVNLDWFNRPWQAFGWGMRPGLAGADAMVAWGVQVLVAGKAWVLFALLFGIGFALVQARRGVDEAGFAAWWKRRMVVLLAIGLAHGALLWPGDILRTYALAGLLLLAGRHLAPGGQRTLGLLAYGGVMGLSIVLALAMMGRGAGLVAPIDAAASATAAQIYAGGEFGAVTLQRLRDLSGLILADIGTVPMAFGVFLLGSWLYRSGRLHDVDRHRGWHRAMVVVALPAGLLASVTIASVLGLNAIQAGGPGHWWLASGLLQLAALPVALGVLSLFALRGQGAGGRLRVWMAAGGRMALSLYLLQSLIASWVFYGYGLGMWDEWGPAVLLAFGVTVFAAQIAFARWWLARFAFGPVEWLWRWASYRRRPPFLRSGPSA